MTSRCKGIAKKAAAAVFAVGLAGCSTTKIIVAPNDLCQVTAVDEKTGDVIGSRHDDGCHQAKMERIRLQAKADYVLQVKETNMRIEENQITLANTVNGELLQTQAHALRLAMREGVADYKEFVEAVRPMVLFAAVSDENKKNLENMGLDVDAIRVQFKAEIAFDEAICKAQAKDGIDVVNPLGLVDKAGQAFAPQQVGHLPFYVDANPEPHGKCVAEQDNNPAPVPAL